MGRIAKILSFVRKVRRDTNYSEIKADPGDGAIITAEVFSDIGDDSYPLPDDWIITVDIPRSGGQNIVGYVDPKNEQKSQPGDKRIYARKEDGSQVVELWLKNDGTAVLQNENGIFELRTDGSMRGNNDNGSYELEQGGNFVVNGVTIDTDGNINTPATLTADTAVESPSVVVDGKELADHTHGGVTSGASNTGPNN